MLITLMAITKQKKEEIIKTMKERLADTKSVVFVNFKGLTVGETKLLRRKLAEDNVGYFVAKKTLAKRVLSDLGTKGDMPELGGELAIAYLSAMGEGSDVLAPSRSTYAFQKAPHDKGSIEILGGIFDGEYKTKEEMVSIALIPSLLGLRGMFVNIINSPIQRFVIALEEIRKQKEAVSA